MQFQVPVPRIAEEYYGTRGQADRHDRNRQDTLDLEKKTEVKEGSLGGNTTLLSVCIVSAWLVQKHSKGSRTTMNQSLFYGKLAEGRIENM